MASIQTFEELVAAVDAASVEPPEGFESWPLGVQPDFQTQSFGDVRPPHAIEAVQKADATAVYEHAGLVVFMCTRRPPDADYALLALGRVNDQRRGIRSAFRLYGEVPSDPTLAFATLLQRMGLKYNAGEGRRVWFVPVLTLAIASPAELPGALEIEEPSGGGEAMIVGSATPGPEGGVRLGWLFILSAAAYRAEMRRHQR